MTYIKSHKVIKSFQAYWTIEAEKEFGILEGCPLGRGATDQAAIDDLIRRTKFESPEFYGAYLAEMDPAGDAATDTAIANQAPVTRHRHWKRDDVTMSAVSSLLVGAKPGAGMVNDFNEIQERGLFDSCTYVGDFYRVYLAWKMTEAIQRQTEDSYSQGS